MGGDDDGSHKNNKKNKNKGFGFGLDVVKEVLVTLLSCLEMTEVEQEQMDHNVVVDHIRHIRLRMIQIMQYGHVR